MKANSADGFRDLVGKVGKVTGKVNVKINGDIIRLFSEGLYQSPHKAIEELVSNSYDAGAMNVHILVPETTKPKESLWIVDDGCGMDEGGLDILWHVAKSPKEDASAKVYRNRKPIGQFGIGKLAAYVLAWRITHISKADGKYRYVSMDFHRVAGTEWDASEPLPLELRELEEEEARKLLKEIEHRDAKAWQLLFGKNEHKTWTAAALTDFRDLANKLRAGTLFWVLSTGLPLVSDFSMYLNGELVRPAKTAIKPLSSITIGQKNDESVARLKDKGIKVCVIKEDGGKQYEGVQFPGIGVVSGEARIYTDPLTTGKSSQVGRSHGFFIRVRGRVINLNDELFGLDALNHAAWARFVMVVNADGLRDYLQSSREGVRESPAIEVLREYLHLKFNECRVIYQDEADKELIGIDLEKLLNEAPSSLIRLPLIDAIEHQVMDVSQRTYYSRRLKQSKIRRHGLADCRRDSIQEYSKLLFLNITTHMAS